MLRLERLGIASFRQLTHVEPFPLAKPTVIVGPNGVGKSTLVRALLFLLTGALDDQDRAALPVEVEGHFQDSEGNHVCLRRVCETDAAPRLEEWRLTPENIELRQLHALKVNDLRDRIGKYLPAYAGSRVTKAPMIAALENFAETQPQIEGWAAVAQTVENELPLVILFASTQEPDPENELRQSLDGTFKAFRSTTDFKSRLEDLEREANAHLETAGESIRKKLAERCGDLGEPALDAKVTISNAFRSVSLTIGDDQHPLESMGAGERRRITLAVWEATAEAFQDIDEDHEGPVRQRVIVYDEPDTHLDYSRQRQLMDLVLDQASRKNDRVLVATHSQNLIDGVDPDGIVVLKKSEDGVATASVFLGGKLDDHVARVAAGLGLRNSVLLNERCFAIVEGPSETASLPLLYRQSRQRRPEADGLVFVCVDGNASALKVAGLLKSLGREVRVVVDRDCRTHQETCKLFSDAELAKHGLDGCLLLVGGDGAAEELEGLFTDEIWAATLNRESPKEDGSRWSSEEIAALRKEKKFSNALHREVYAQSGLGADKPALMRSVAEQCQAVGHVPAELATVFEELGPS